MLSVFIGFGGPEAKKVAEDLEGFLRVETTIKTFLASPGSNTLPANIANFHTIINRELLDCNIAVFVCHKGTPRSTPVKKEIDLLYSRNLENKIIPFAASDECLPKKLREHHWHPLHFPPERPEESFPRLLNSIYRSYFELMESTRITSENAPLVRQ
jgi:hypothetical protein